MFENTEGSELQNYEPREFLLIVGIITIGSTLIYLMCMCMHKFHCFITTREEEFNGKLINLFFKYFY